VHRVVTPRELSSVSTLCLRASLFEQWLGDVNPENLAIESDCAGCRNGRASRTATQVEHALPCLQRQPRNRRCAEPVPETERAETV